jgi:hemoglobin/transferrin/lactoferrin receptor protein
MGKRAAILLGSVGLSILSVQGAFAQDAEAVEGAATTAKQDRITVLDQIVVGAGVEKVAIDTPQSVTVLDQRDIDERQAATVGDVLKGIPGVNTAGSDRVFGQAFNIRGIGGAEAAGEEGRIIVNVDGATKFYEQYRMGSFFSDPELYKRVEVLRGPASSTLYGSGALGGVINFTTKDASDFVQEGKRGALRLKGSFDSNENGWLGSAILAHKFSENLEMLLAGNYRYADPYRTGDGTEILSSGINAWSGLAKVTGKIGEEGTFRASYQHWDSNAADQDYAQIGGTVSSGSVTGFGTVDRHVIDKTAVVAYENPVSDNDWIDLKIQGSFSDTSVTQRDATGVPPGAFGPTAFDCTAPGGELFCDTDFSYKTWQGKVENTSEWHGENWKNFLTYGWQTSYQIRTAEAVSSLGDPLAFDFHPEGTDFKTGFYIQNEYIWDDRLTIIPGARVDWHNLTPGDSTPLTESSDDWAFSPKLAAHYKFNDTFAVFGSVAHTERFPTLDEVFSTSYAPSYGLKKERSDNFEAGFSVSGYDLLQSGDGLQFKATGFYNNVNDLITSCEGTAKPCGTVYDEHYMNIGKALIYGAELELAYDSDYVFGKAGYSYVIGKDRETKAYLTSVAPHELSLEVGGKLPEYGVKFGWRARIVASPQDSALRSSTVNWTGTSTRYSEAFNVHDIYISWKPEDGAMKGWEAQFGVDNLFNTQYKEFLHNDAAKGRTFKVTLAKQFDY